MTQDCPRTQMRSYWVQNIIPAMVPGPCTITFGYVDPLKTQIAAGRHDVLCGDRLLAAVIHGHGDLKMPCAFLQAHNSISMGLGKPTVTASCPKLQVACHFQSEHTRDRSPA